MSSQTPPFVPLLITNAVPVRPLRSPWIRAAMWSGLSLLGVGAMVLIMSRFTKVSAVHIDQGIVIEQLAALATGITAAAAAFATTVPGYRRRIVLVPLVPLAIWLATLGQWCIQDGLASGFSLRSVTAHWGCLPATILMGAIPAGAIVLMLRRGAPLMPRLTTILAAMAAAGLGNFGVRFVHSADASLVVLAWHFTAVFALSFLSALAGRSLFNWRQLLDRNPA